MSIVDQSQRKKIENNLNTTFMVEAGAGAGKTTSLVRRMINQIIEGKFTIDKIAAITFTKKAATELRERFQMELENKCSDEKLNEEGKEKVIRALEEINQCYIGTIHSFCSKLLRERPIEGKVNLNFEEMDDSETNKLKTKIWYEFLDNIYENRPDIIKELRDNEIDIDALRDTYFDISEYHPSDLEIVYEVDNTLDDATENIFNEIKIALEENKKYTQGTIDYKWQQRLSKAIKDTTTMKDIKEKFAFIKNADEILKNISTYYKCKNKELSDEDIEKLKNKVKDDIKGLEKKIKKLKKDLINRENIVNNFERFKIGMDFIKGAVNFYYKEKEESGKLSFQDLLVKTRDMLRDNSEIRQYFSTKYQYLLVDEFQDTDPIQAEIMFFITGEDKEEKDWRKLRVRQGSLFIVGDPKQSIYRFRNADISLYNQVKELVEESKGEILELTTNFRSYNDPVNWFNSKFKHLLGSKTTKYQSKFNKMESYKKSSDDTLKGVTKLKIEDNGMSTSEQVARHISNMISKNIKIDVKINDINTTRAVEYKDFMILTYKKDEVEYYKNALEELDIPCCSTGKFKLGDYSSIQSILNLLKYIRDTEDSISLIGALKGLYGISDQMLLDSKYYGLKLSHYNNLKEIESDTKKELKPLLSAYENISKYINLTYKISPIVLLNKIINDTKILPWSLSSQEDKYSYKHLYQIIEQLRNNDDSKFDFIKMVEQFEYLCNEMVEEVIEVNTVNINAVRIMNVHKSKGLEAPIVILASDKDNNSSPISHINRDESGNKGYFTIFKKDTKYGKNSIKLKPSRWEDIAIEEKKYKDAEKIRLQYVAATRAENTLFIVSSGKENIYKDLYDDDTEVVDVDNTKVLKTGSEVDIITVTEDNDWQDDLRTSTYTFKSPTQDEKIESKVKVDPGGSQELGIIIHKVFEEVVKGNKHIEELINKLVSESTKHKGDFDKVKLAVKKFEDSELMKEIKKSSEVYPEAKFSISIDKESELYGLYLGDDINCDKIYLNGVIDLIFKIDGKWKIVDYKTDQVKNIEDAKLRSIDYKKQVDTYIKVWKEITSEDVSNVELYFTYLGEIINILELDTLHTTY